MCYSCWEHFAKPERLICLNLLSMYCVEEQDPLQEGLYYILYSVNLHIKWIV